MWYNVWVRGDDTLTIEKPQTASSIDILSEGFSAINRRLWLVLIPLIINIVFWYGPQISFTPIFAELATSFATVNSAQIEQTTSANSITTEDLLAALGTVSMNQGLARFNLVPTLTMYQMINNSADLQADPGSIVAGTLSMYRLITLDLNSRSLGMWLVQEQPQMLSADRPSITITNMWSAILTFVIVNAIALPISATFFTLLAAAARNDTANTAVYLRRIKKASIAILSYGAAAFAAGILLVLPIIFLMALIGYFSVGLALILLSLLVIAAFWVRIYLGFTNEAIVVSGIGPIQAIKASVHIVQRYFWRSLGFIFLSWLISVGAGVLWLSLQQTTIGLIIAVCCSAYLGSGLLAARMLFYREHLRLWQQSLSRTR
jgi:hypothetical protein